MDHPTCAIPDDGSAFRDTFIDMVGERGIIVTSSSAYNRAINGPVERAVQSKKISQSEDTRLPFSLKKPL